MSCKANGWFQVDLKYVYHLLEIQLLIHNALKYYLLFFFFHLENWGETAVGGAGSSARDFLG